MPTPMIDSLGVVHDVPDEHVEARAAMGWRPQTFDDVLAAATAASNERAYGGVGGGLRAAGAATLRGATLGLSDVAARALGGDDAAIALEGLRAENPGLSSGFELGGALAPALITGGAGLLAGAGEGVARLGAGATALGAERIGAGLASAGSGIAGLGAEGGALSRLGASAIGRAAEYAPSSLVGSLGGRVSEAVGGGLRGALASGATEGALYGAGTGVSELALQQDPLTWERAATTIGSSALFGAGAGAAFGAAGNAVERGLERAGRAIDQYIATRSAREAVASDLSGLDRKGLRAAEEAEHARIEAERVGQRAQVADEIAAFRDDLKQQKIWLTTKKTTDPPVGAPVPAEAPPVSPPAARIPGYDELRASDRDFIETTIPAREIADRGYFEPPGAGTDATRNAKAAQAIKEGQREPISLMVTPSGKIAVEGGRHRLAAAIEQDAPIRVRWSTGAEPSEDMVARGAARTADLPRGPLKKREYSGLDEGAADFEPSAWFEGPGSYRPLGGDTFTRIQDASEQRLSQAEYDALGHYSTDSAYEINRKLRTGAVPSDIKPQVDLIDSAIAKSPLPEDIRVFRGLSDEGVRGNELAKLKPGDTLEEAGFVSTSAQPESARGFGQTDGGDNGQGAVMLVVDVPRGTPAAAISGESPLETEILLGRNTRYRVVSNEIKSSVDEFGDALKPERVIHVVLEKSPPASAASSHAAQEVAAGGTHPPPGPLEIAKGKTVPELSSDIAADFLLARARQNGEVANAFKAPGEKDRVWLGSLGIDWSVPENKEALLKLLRERKVTLARKDMAFPKEKAIREASEVTDKGATFHMIEVPPSTGVPAVAETQAPIGKPIEKMTLKEVEKFQEGINAKLDKAEDGSREYVELSKQWDRAVERRAHIAKHGEGSFAEQEVLTGPSGLSEPEFDAYARDWRKSLGPETERAFQGYTQNGAYSLINAPLRKGEGIAGVPENLRGMVSQLDRGIAETRAPREMTLFRGVSGVRSTKQWGGLKVGDSLIDPGYGSTSIQHHVGKSYAKGTGVRSGVEIRIRVPEGFPAAPVPSKTFGAEREILLPRDTKYTVTSIEQRDGGKVIHVDVSHGAAGTQKPQTWREFTASKMSEYMQSEGGHAGAMKRIGEEWRAMKGGGIPSAPDGAKPLADGPTLPESAPAPAPPAAVEPPQIEGLGPLGKRLLKTDRALDRLLDNPKALAAKPQRALDALQMQEAAYEDILAKADQLRIKFAGDTSGDRVAALDAIPAALERNRALQAKISELLQPPRTPRLDEIAHAHDVLSQPAPPKSMIEQAFGGTMFGAASTAARSIPLIGQIPGVAHFVGAKGAELATRVVFGKLGDAVGAQAARAKTVVEALLGLTKATIPYAPLVATKVLAGIRYGSAKRESDPEALPDLFKTRTDEIKQLTAYDETGTPRLRPEVRQQIGAKLRPISIVDPIMADRIETALANRIEYLSSIIPRRPDIGGIPTGPDNWRPSDMAMRTWARSAAAAEDPYAVLERAVHGNITPEDAATMRAVHPEILADFTQRVTSQLPELRQTLPFDRQLSLSILTGTPVAASLDPKILRVLQGQFPDEPGSSGGTQAPKAQPSFGSMRKSIDQPTPAQNRAQGAHV